MPVNFKPTPADQLHPVAGLRIGTAMAGVRKANRRDLLLLARDEGCAVAGVFTKNRFCAAPAQVCREHLAVGSGIRAMVVNTGLPMPAPVRMAWRVPVVLRPVALAAPVQVSGSYAVTFGYDGAFSATPHGLVALTVTSDTVAQDPDQTFDAADTAGTVAIQVVIPAGTTYTRFALFDADVALGADIDLYVHQGSTLVGSSGGGSSAEEVNFTFANPTAAPIALTVYVHGWGLPGGTSPFKLNQWYLGTSAAGNMIVTAPASATLGGSGHIGLTFSGLAAGTRYLGSVAYGGRPPRHRPPSCASILRDRSLTPAGPNVDPPLHHTRPAKRFAGRCRFSAARLPTGDPARGPAGTTAVRRCGLRGSPSRGRPR